MELLLLLWHLLDDEEDADENRKAPDGREQNPVAEPVEETDPNKICYEALLREDGQSPFQNE